MRCIFISLLFILGTFAVVRGQDHQSDSLKYLLENTQHDTNSVKLILKLSVEIAFSNPDSSLVLDQKALAIAKELHYTQGVTNALNSCGEDFHFLGNYADALKMQFEALELNRQLKDARGEATTLSLIGVTYNDLGEYRQAIQYLIPADTICQKLPRMFQVSFILSNLGDSYDFLKMPDSAAYYQHKAYEKFDEQSPPQLKSFILRHMGNVYARSGRNDSALKFYNDAIINSRISNDKLNLGLALTQIAELYESAKQYDSSFHYAHEAYANAQSVPSKQQILRSSKLLASLYNKIHQPDSAYAYLGVAAAMKDSLYGPEKFRQLQVLMLSEQQRQEAILRHEEQFRNKIKYILLLSALGIFLLLAFILLRNNRHKQKANSLLKEQKTQIETTLTELKSTQAQLVQSEKMASLGELTAGIAHEIQNPLNFVNNFSEVNKELIAEMKNEIDAGNFVEVRNISKNIEDNEEKIIFHGKRADTIVKGMLQHSRSSGGIKEPADINALADEYLRLAYHGLRAKDKSFNATMKTDYDATIGNISIIPQDIGRAILNLITNAFYAVTEKKSAYANISPDNNYEPTVSVSTKKMNDNVEIRVTDNGNGIPQKILDKVFQPFFTTKPTGHGTGLGLSLAYDIIKAHGGEIKVKSKEGEGSEFVIQLPAL